MNTTEKPPSFYFALSIFFLIVFWIELITLVFLSDSSPAFLNSLEFTIFTSVFTISSYYILPAFSLIFLVLTISPLLSNRTIKKILILEIIVIVFNIIFYILAVNHYQYTFIRNTELECKIQSSHGYLNEVNCYEKLAKTTNDINYCRKGEEQCVDSSTYSDLTKECARASASCFTHFALVEGNPSLCPKSKTGCVAELAKELSNPALCEELTYSEKEYRFCYASVAEKTKDYSLCEKYVIKETPREKMYGDEGYEICERLGFELRKGPYCKFHPEATVCKINNQ